MSKFTNRYLEDGSYLSIRNIQLSYTFDKKMLRKTFLNGLVLSFNIDNLHTFTKYTGTVDARCGGRTECVGFGVHTGYPLSRNFTMGLKVTL